MNSIRLAAAAATFFAAACTPAPADNADAQAPQTARAEASGKPNSDPPHAGESLTPAQLAGRWGDNGDCTKDLILNADGTFRSYTGGGGTWTLQGDLLTMTGDGGTFQVRIAMASADTLMVGQPDGSFGMSQRCPQ